MLVVTNQQPQPCGLEPNSRRLRGYEHSVGVELDIAREHQLVGGDAGDVSDVRPSYYDFVGFVAALGRYLQRGTLVCDPLPRVR